MGNTIGQKTPRILMIATSADKLECKDGSVMKTGAWAEEVFEPKKTFEDAGFLVDIATLRGNKVAFDAMSLKAGVGVPTEEKSQEYIKLTEAPEMKSPLNLQNLGKEELARYDVLFIAGGHGVLADLATSPEMGKLLESAVGNARQIVSAVCHGPSVFQTLTLTGKDKPLENIKATGFSDAEETTIPHNLIAPETTLKELGVAYSKAENPWVAHVVSSGMTADGKAKFITGQNPASSKPLADEIVANFIKQL